MTGEITVLVVKAAKAGSEAARLDGRSGFSLGPKRIMWAACARISFSSLQSMIVDQSCGAASALGFIWNAIASIDDLASNVARVMHFDSVDVPVSITREFRQRTRNRSASSS